MPAIRSRSYTSEADDLPVSRLRSPFASACLNVRPMAITSPTLFICVPMVVTAPGNFSNCQRGIFTTT